MGCFDQVKANCKNCGHHVLFQSKAGKCEMKQYKIGSVPPVIAEDLAGDNEKCDYCGSLVVIATAKAIPRVKMVVLDKLLFEQWLEINEERLAIEAAESGSDREFDFDRESYEENKYEEYLKS